MIKRIRLGNSLLFPTYSFFWHSKKDLNLWVPKPQLMDQNFRSPPPYIFRSPIVFYESKKLARGPKIFRDPVQNLGPKNWLAILRFLGIQYKIWGSQNWLGILRFLGIPYKIWASQKLVRKPKAFRDTIQTLGVPKI